MFRSISCGINNTERWRVGERREGSTQSRRQRETINYRSSALSPRDTGGTPRATDILNLHRRPGESFVRISLRANRARSREGGWKREWEEGWAPVGNSLREHESRGGYLIRSRPGRLLPNTFCKRGYIDLQFPVEARRAQCIPAIKFSYPFNKTFAPSVILSPVGEKKSFRAVKEI